MTHFTAARGLGEASRLLGADTAAIVSAGLFAVTDGERTDAGNMAEAAIARVEAAQVISKAWPLDSVVDHFRSSTTARDNNAYGAALFLIALCDPSRRASIQAALTEIQGIDSSRAVDAGQVLEMLESLGPESEVNSRPWIFDATLPIAPAFQIAGEAMGDNLFMPPFCPTP